MRLRLHVQVGEQSEADLLIDADPEAEVAELARAAGRAAGLLGDSIDLWTAGAKVDPSGSLASSGLVQGATVGLGSGPVREIRRPSPRGWQLHVVGGPCAGSIFELTVGRHEIGRQSGLHLADPAASRQHAVINVTADGASVADLGSANGTMVDGRPAPIEGGDDPLVIGPGAIISIGDSLLTIAISAVADAPTEIGPEGTIEFRRPPRIQPDAPVQRIALPSPPARDRRRRFPVVAIAAPLLFGVLMAVSLKKPNYLFFALATPLMALANFLSQRHESAQDERDQKVRYEDRLATAMSDLEAALASETQRRREEQPDPAALFLTAILPGRRLWERRRTDDDFCKLRVGLSDLPAQVKVDAPRGGEEDVGASPRGRIVYSVPASVELRKVGVLGVAGPTAEVDALVRWFVLQLAVLHAPHDLTLSLLTSPRRSQWSWLSWLPQAAEGDPEASLSRIGNDAETIKARIAELGSMIRARRAAAEGSRLDPSQVQTHVVIVDGAHDLRTVPGLAQVLRDGPSVGVYAICIDAEDRLLPEECAGVVIIDVDQPTNLVVRITGRELIADILADQLSVEAADQMSRSLAPLRNVAIEDGEAAIPDSARLLDLIGLEPPTVDGVRSRWMLGGRTTEMIVGIGTAGPFTIDLRLDGPHGLIAGTTGAGKSELLQTMIASLATANRPEEMNFVLVDYKGGSAFKDCVKLPHTVGMVTDLDAHLVERALTSLAAELHRREHLLAASGAKDIEDYQDLRDRDGSLPPLSRLLLVIDEFASMVRELPDFVTGLVSIAQRGRSLGIHLLLATQRPSGVVSAEIRANTNLRISLRVMDASDSQDVIESADAAQISKWTPGRAFARLGASTPVAFQSARVGGRRPGASPLEPLPVSATVITWGQLGYSIRPPERKVIERDDVATDLGDLVEAIAQAARAEGSSTQPSPWLPALSSSLLLDDLVDVEGPGELPLISFGLRDLPAEQAQRPASLDLDGGHLFVLGSSRSGRSQLLRTIAGSVATLQRPQDVHIYGLDCGNGALLALESLPHCGAIVRRDQVERSRRLISRLGAEISRRQSILAAGGFADVSEQRRSAPQPERLAHILFMLDRWESFTTTLGELDAGAVTEEVMAIVRDGATAGVHCIFTGDRSLASGRVGSLCDNKIAMRFADSSDYSFIGINARNLPEEVPAGRAFEAETAIEMQVALLVEDASGQAQAAALEELGRRGGGADGEGPEPFRVDELPSSLTFVDAQRFVRPADGAGLFCLVGIGGDELAAMGPDLAKTRSFVVAGPGRSGRSTVLRTMAESLLAQGAELLVVAPRPSPLRDLLGQPGVLEVLTDPTDTKRAQEILAEEVGGRHRVVLLDDGDDLRDLPFGQTLQQIVQGRSTTATAVVLAGSPQGICTGFSGWQVELKQTRCGVLLSPQSVADGEVVGLRLSRASTTAAPRPGRGLLHLGDGSGTEIVIPSMDQPGGNER